MIFTKKSAKSKPFFSFQFEDALAIVSDVATHINEDMKRGVSGIFMDLNEPIVLKSIQILINNSWGKHKENQYHVGDFICDKILLKISLGFLGLRQRRFTK